MIMQKDALNNVHISDEIVLISPEELKQKYPLSRNDQHAIAGARKTIADIVHHRDPRLLVVCGPCSVHDTDAALEYARRLKELSAELSDSLYIVMRVYFEKPRTTVGWKGLISDPFMDGSFEMEKGLHIARKLMVDLVQLGLPLAGEALDRITRSTSGICSAGLLSVHVPLNHRHTVKWHPVCPCRSALKTGLTAA